MGAGTVHRRTLSYSTYETKRDVTFPIRVASGDDADSQEVTVYAVGTDLDRHMGVSIGWTTGPMTGGDYLEVVTSVGNSATTEVTDTIELVDSSGNLLDSRELTLPGEATETIGLGWETYPVKSTVSFPVTVRSSGDKESREVTVYGTG